jgi:sec-independent protein translocase protein TatB
VFGLSFGELAVIIVVALVVMGPKELPKMLRKVGQYAGKLRRMASDLRAQSGIDDALRAEGLAEDIAEIRKLARGEIEGAVVAARSATAFRDNDDVAASPYTANAAPPADVSDGVHPPTIEDLIVDREREYPREGADSYGALPDTAVVYAETFPSSPLADDPLYTRGEDVAAPAVPLAAREAESTPLESKTSL